MGSVRPASATSEAIEAEGDVLHPRAVGEGGKRAQRAVVGVGERSEWRRPRSSCRIASITYLSWIQFKVCSHHDFIGITLIIFQATHNILRTVVYRR